jgi:hypothetical protein
MLITIIAGGGRSSCRIVLIVGGIGSACLDLLATSINKGNSIDKERLCQTRHQLG